MILIADSGSTKTDWILWNSMNSEVSYFHSIGLNPYFVSHAQITEVVSEILQGVQASSITEIYFYGSGCGSDESVKTVETGLKAVCNKALISIEHDLMAAARALFGNDSGIACIMGTGSNACLYNGTQIMKEAVSYGYVMGDEGSGNHLGRLLLKAVFSRKVPENIREAFFKSYPDMDISYLLEQLYHSSSPNRFLASFSPFLFQHKKDQYIQDLISQSFHQFLDEFVMDFLGDAKYPVSFQGSIAFLYQDILKKVLKERELVMGRIIKEPIGALLEYHRLPYE